MRAMLLLVLGAAAGAQPAPPRQASNWDVWTVGGKGGYAGAPECHSREAFLAPPPRFDYEGDFSRLKPSQMKVATKSRRVGMVEGRAIVEVDQTVDFDSGFGPVHFPIKRLLVQRGGAEYCMIYQLSGVGLKAAELVSVGGRAVLKSLDPNGQATWNEEYWVFDREGPFHLDLGPVRAELDAAVPKGDRARDYPLDVKSANYRCGVFRDVNEGNGGTDEGWLTALIGLRGHELRAAGVRFRPESEQRQGGGGEREPQKGARIEGCPRGAPTLAVNELDAGVPVSGAVL